MMLPSVCVATLRGCTARTKRHTDTGKQSQVLVAAENRHMPAWGEWTGLDGTAGPHMLTQGDIGRLLRPFAIRSKTLWAPGRRTGTKSESGYSLSNSRRHGSPIANQAPHRHRQAKSGTCRGREPPHARHTFEAAASAYLVGRRVNRPSSFGIGAEHRSPRTSVPTEASG